MITFDDGQDVRYRLVLATLAGKSIKISNIRPNALDPGLTDYEVSFLRLIESITNGSVIEISYTGTTVIYKPGIIIGGSFTHNCPLSKPVGYYIEPVLLLAPFAKKTSNIVFKGATSSDSDVGVDAIRTVYFPILEKFGIDRSELRIIKRGSLPKGGGEVVLMMPHLILQPDTIHAINQIQVAKIRGVAYSTRVSPASVNRVIETARGVLKNTNVETFIYSDVTRGDESGLSPGFGVTVVAETRSGWPVGTQAVAESGSVPDELGLKVAQQLLYELSLKGGVGRMGLPLILVLMALGKEDVGRLLIGSGELSSDTVNLLRDLYKFFHVRAIVRESEDHPDSYVLAIKGSNFVSASKKMA